MSHYANRVGTKCNVGTLVDGKIEHEEATVRSELSQTSIGQFWGRSI